MRLALGHTPWNHTTEVEYDWLIVTSMTKWWWGLVNLNCSYLLIPWSKFQVWYVILLHFPYWFCWYIWIRRAPFVHPGDTSVFECFLGIKLDCPLWGVSSFFPPVLSLLRCRCGRVVSASNFREKQNEKKKRGKSCREVGRKEVETEATSQGKWW